MTRQSNRRRPDFRSFLRSIVETLDRLGLLYAIGGSVASSIYGEARSTLDGDIGAILAVQGDSLDTAYIALWAARIGASDIWDALWAAYRSSQL